MPSEDIDQLVFAVLRERHLRLYIPAAAAKERSDLADNRGMTLVEESVEVARAPAHEGHHVGVDRGEYPPEPSPR